MILESDRIILRPMVIEDADLIVKWRSDPEISKWVFSEPPTIEEHLKWFYGPKPDRIDYVICLKDSTVGGFLLPSTQKEIPIGTVNFKNIDMGHSAEAGKILGDHSQWGKGLAEEAFVLWLKDGFEQLRFKKIYAFTKMNNSRNIQLNLQIGFIIEKVTEDDILVMSIHKKDLNEKTYN